jgi:hypothetical protein
LADSRFAANPASREAALDAATRDVNKRAWAHIHNRILFALVMRNQGENTIASDFTEGRINLHLSWFGNELVGENGIAQNPNWPYDGPSGHWPTLLEDSERHFNWLVNKAKELDLQSASRALVC